MKRIFNTLWSKRLILAAAVLIFSLSSCGGKPDISDYEDMPVQIIGLTEDDFEITPAGLAEMKCESGSGQGGSEKSGNVDGYGPTLDTFLAEYGKERSDFSKIIFTAKDDYKKTVWGDMLEDGKIVLSIANGEEPLNENETPMRLLIPGAESAYWVYGVVKIEFIK